MKYFDNKVGSYFINDKINRSDKYVSFFDSLKPIGFRLVKNDGKIDILPITIKDKFNKQSTNSFYLPKYTTICLKNQPVSKGMFYIIGRPNKKIIEIKPIMCHLDKNTNFYNDFICSEFKIRKDTRLTIGLNMLIKEFDLVVTDELGNIYQRKSFEKLLTE